MKRDEDGCVCSPFGLLGGPGGLANGWALMESGRVYMDGEWTGLYGWRVDGFIWMKSGWVNMDG